MAGDGYRLQAKKFFLTYPQCEVPKGEALEAILQQFGDDLNYAVVAEEEHEDGTPHLHCIINLKKKLRIRSAKWFDFVTGQHGNYVAQKKEVENLQYVIKGGDYVAEGIDVEAFLAAALAKKSTKSTLVARKILDGATFDQVLEEEPGYVLQNKRKIDDLMSYVRSKKNKTDMIDVESFQFKPWQRTVYDRLMDQNDRTVLWVWEARGGRGKTTLAKYLVAAKGAFLCPNGKSENVAHAYECQEIVAIDYTRDYEGFINYSVLESFKNGYIFSSKYESQVKYFKPAKLVVFANFAPDMSKMSADRWDIFEIPDVVRG